MRSTSHEARSTGDTESGSLEPDENTVPPPVDRAHKDDVNLIPSGRPNPLCMGSISQGLSRPGQLWGTLWRGSVYPVLDDFRWNFGYPFWTQLIICEDVLSQRSSRLLRLHWVPILFNLEQYRTPGYPLLYLCTKRLCSGIVNPNPFRWLSRLYDASGLTFDLGLDCLSLLILNRTVLYCLHVMSMFFNSVYFTLYWDHIENLDDGLMIPFDVPFILRSVWSVEIRRLWL